MPMQGHGKHMEREVAHYRGYTIEGENDDQSWLLRVQPAKPNLPILGLSSFRVVEPNWDRALGEAHTHIDAMLGEHESLQKVGSRHPLRLELIFNNVWEVIRPQGTVR